MTATTPRYVRAVGAGGPANRQREPLDKAIVSNSDRRVWRRPGEGRVWRHIFALLPVVLTLNDGAGAADRVLAPTGTLRAAYIVANVAQARLDSGTGAITGVVADITRELGRRAGVPITITPLPTAAAVLEAVRTDAADIGFVAPNPERTGVVLYSQTYMLVHRVRWFAPTRRCTPCVSWTGPAKSSASTPTTAWACGCRSG